MCVFDFYYSFLLFNVPKCLNRNGRNKSTQRKMVVAQPSVLKQFLLLLPLAYPNQRPGTGLTTQSGYINCIKISILITVYCYEK